MTLAKEITAFFARFVEAEIGVVYAEANYYQLESRLADIARAVGEPDVESLYALCRRGIGGDLKTRLLDAATNNETSFFRDHEVFQAIRERLLTPGAPARTNPYQIWSAACSTGQEPYSLAMLFAELAPMGPNAQVEILATDVSDRALSQARGGTYSQLEVQRGLPSPLLLKYFTEAQGGSTPTQTPLWKIADRLRRVITFRKLNLLQSWPASGPFDLILCRNVLIYHTPANKLRIISRLHQALVPGGHLILGGAESLNGLSDAFALVSSGKAILYQKERPAA